MPGRAAVLPMFAHLMVEKPAVVMPTETEVTTGVEIVVGDVVIRVSPDADEGLPPRSIRAAAS